VLETGEITHQGPPAVLANDARVVATYLGGST
jgi:ABC-type branched-subunit amino acid transport system ATPase component